MILVTVGTIQYEFCRMVSVVSMVKKQCPKQRIIIQSGHTRGFRALSSELVEVYSFVSQDQLWKLMSEARILLMHGGEGSLLDAFEWSKYQPIVFPRNPQFGEHVDEYQLEIASEASRRGLCNAVFSEKDAVKAVINRLNHRTLLQKRKHHLQNDALITYLNKLTTGWGKKHA